jgi:hypothetical protein
VTMYRYREQRARSSYCRLSLHEICPIAGNLLDRLDFWFGKPFVNAGGDREDIVGGGGGWGLDDELDELSFGELRGFEGAEVAVFVDGF